MSRGAACLAQAFACREQALADPVNRDHWIDQSIKWLDLAIGTGDLVIASETKDKQPQTKNRA